MTGLSMIGVAGSSLILTGCSLVGPSCLARQERDVVAQVTGVIEAGAMRAHRVAYGTRGSQNDVAISWIGQDSPSGPRIEVYATRVDCQHFVPPGTGDCTTIGSRGGTAEGGGIVQNSLIIANGRGNRDILGTPAEYVLWVIGDRLSRVSYVMEMTSFYGPDC